MLLFLVSLLARMVVVKGSLGSSVRDFRVLDAGVVVGRRAS